MANLAERLKEPPNDDVLTEHLGYSSDLVAMALREMTEPPHDDKLREWFRQMSAIEVFWTQARLLHEFFSGAFTSSTTCSAEHFTEKKITYDLAFGGKDLPTMMNNQIAHMNAGRTTDPDEKLSREQMYAVGAAIGRALTIFGNNLPKGCAELWNNRTTGRIEIDAARIYVGGAPGASSAAPGVLQSQSTTTDISSFQIVGLTGPSGSGR